VTIEIALFITKLSIFPLVWSCTEWQYNHMAQWR